MEPQVIIERSADGKLEIKECPEVFICSRESLEAIIHETNKATDLLNKSRRLADDLAQELSCLADWRECHDIDCHYDPRPLENWYARNKN